MDPRGARAGAVSAPGKSSDAQLVPARVEAALAAAQIPASKLGAARRARLKASERELYLWILRRFARSGRPSRSELDAAASRLGTDLDSTLATLARKDLAGQGWDIRSSGDPTAATTLWCHEPPGRGDPQPWCRFGDPGVCPRASSVEP